MLRSLLAHKLRLVLSAVAVVLGTLFMSAAFVAGDTIAAGFEQLFTTVNQGVDVQVTAELPISNGQGQGPPVVTAFVDQATADKIAAVPGVARSVPSVASNGARVIGKDGKVVGTTGPPRNGLGWTSNTGGPGDLIQLRTGRGPAAPDEIAINASLAKTTGFRIGDRVDVLTLQPRRTFTLVGIFGFRGGRDTLGGETAVAFTLPVAQQLMLGRTGVFTNIEVTAAPGVSPQELKRRVAGVVGPGFVVRTGAEAARAASRDVAAFTSVLKTGLVVFALIGLFTGAFLIFNTFSMLVAQRTGELALYRAFGASRGQVNRSVLIESILVGLLASILGLLLGIGIGWGLVQGLEALANTSLPIVGVTVRPYAIITTLLVGTAITVLAALVPSLRASRVAPIAAIREAAFADRPLWRLTVAGAVVLAAGAGLLAVKLTNLVEGNLGLLLGAGGVLAFLGVAMLAPVLSRPCTGLLGRLFGRGVAGRLGTRNTGRNPRRTAVTAAALTIGVTLATGAGVFVSSAKAGVSKLFRQDLNAELGVVSDFSAGAAGGFDPALAGQMRAIPGVQTALAVRADRVQLGGSGAMVSATDVDAARTIFRLTPKEGELRPLNAGELLLDEATAGNRRLAVGDTVTMRTSRGGDMIERVVGVFARNQVVGGPLVSPADAGTFTSPLAQQGFVKVTDPGQVAPVRAQLDRLFAANPEISVVDSSALLAQQNRLLDVILAILYVLLALTILVAVLGVINTLLLSVFERTRELGLLRAVGLGRGQVGRMVTVESILISVFGTLLGIVVGVALGVAIVSALGSRFLSLTVPWTYLVITLALAVLAGVVAAILPAIRAARLNVLQAIAYE
jgi:putative ABC transport system permease protein